MIGGEKDECNENGCKTKHLFRKNDNNNSSSSVYFNFFHRGIWLEQVKKDILAYGVIDMLGTALMMDKFKVLMVMFTAGIYTAGFCYDFKHHYIRMILARTDLISYSISNLL